jgi:hypothetical protein
MNARWQIGKALKGACLFTWDGELFGYFLIKGYTRYAGRLFDSGAKCINPKNEVDGGEQCDSKLHFVSLLYLYRLLGEDKVPKCFVDYFFLETLTCLLLMMLRCCLED